MALGLEIILAAAASVAGVANGRELVVEWLNRARQDLRQAERQKKLWSRVHYVLGVPSAALSGAAGVTAVASGPVWIAATLAFSSAILGAVHVFLRPEEKSREQARAIVGQREDIDALELALAVDLPDDVDAAATREVLNRLLEQRRSHRDALPDSGTKG